MATLTDYTERNREAWDAVADRHRAASWAKTVEAFKQPGFSRIKELEAKKLDLLGGVAGKRIAHPCCNSGIELVSLATMGATGVGFDISPNFVAMAQELATVAKAPVDFVCTDVLRIPDQYKGAFDLVYISVVTLGWMQDLPGFFDVVRSLLGSQGQVFIYEMHPFLDMLEDDLAAPLKLHHSYFRTEPYIEVGKLDYLGKTTYEAPPAIWFHHKMSDIIGALLAKGFALRFFEEMSHDVSATFRHLEREAIRPPLSYALGAELGLR